MEHAGMVDALAEIRRVLVPDGVLIDLRPILDRWPVEVISTREVRETGRMQDFPIGLADDAAANRAIAQASTSGWFTREREDFFSYDYIWDTPRELEEWIVEEWQDFIDLDEEDKHPNTSTLPCGGEPSGCDGHNRLQTTQPQPVAGFRQSERTQLRCERLPAESPM